MNLAEILKKSCEDFSYETKEYSVTFKPSYITAPVITNEKIKARNLIISLNVQSKTSTNQFKTEFKFLSVPINDGFGFELKGKRVHYPDEYLSTSGWYLSDDKKGVVLQFRPDTGKYFSITRTNQGFQVLLKAGVASDQKISLLSFLKFISGYTNQQISDMIGKTRLTNLILNKEMTSSEALDEVKKAVIYSQKNTTAEAKTDSESFLTVDDIRDKFFKETFTKLNEFSRKRTENQYLFSSRCTGSELFSDLEVNGRVLKAGYKLTPEDLAEIDKLNISTLPLIDSNNKLCEVKKYNISETLSPDEIYMAVNRFMSYICGVGSVDDRNSVQSKSVRTYETRVRQSIDKAFASLIHNIDEKLAIFNRNISKDNTGELINVPYHIRLNGLKPGYVNDLIKDLTDQTNGTRQYIDTINAFDLISTREKTKTDIGKNTNIEEIAVQMSQRNYMNTIESPESDKSGKVLQMNLFTEVNADGELLVPYFKVKNGIVDDSESVLLSSNQIFNKYVGEWDYKYGESSEKVPATIRDEIILVEPTKLDYVRYSPYVDFATASSLSPFPGFSNPKRTLMESNHIKQCFKVIRSQSPIVLSGSEGMIKYQKFGMVLTARMILEEFAEYDSSIHQQKEAFGNSVLRLDSTFVSSNTRVLHFKTTFNGTEYLIKKTVPYLKKTVDSNIVSFDLNPYTNNTYSGDEVVAYEQSIFIGERTIDKYMDLGYMKVTDDLFKYSLAIGTNILVGFGTHNSTNIDDAATLSEELQYNYALSHISMNKIEHPLKTRVKGGVTQKQVAYKGKASETNKSYSNIENGLPKVGTRIQPNDPVFLYTYITEDKKPISSSPTAHVAPTTVEGQVVHSEIIENPKNPSEDIMVAYIADLAPIECGDKISGRYGNKGVIADVIPMDSMPFIQRNGKILQAILNPLGVPSRMNISQLIEVELSKSYVWDKNNKDEELGSRAVCISSFNPDTLDIVFNKSDEFNLGLETVVDGETGIPKDRPMQVGYMYIYKLKHIVKKKINSSGFSNNINQVTGQPKQGAGGGQSFSEYEHWCLEASGCSHILQTLQTIQSNSPDIDKFEKEIIKNPYEVDVEGSNINDSYFKILPTLMQLSLDTKVCEDESGSFTANSYKPLTDNLLKQQAEAVVKNEEALFSDTIFGNIQKGKIKDNSLRERWGYIELNCNIINPFILYTSMIPKLLPVTFTPENPSRAWVGTILTDDNIENPVFKDLFVLPKKYNLGRKIGKERLLDSIMKGNMYTKVVDVPATETSESFKTVLVVSKSYSASVKGSKTGMGAVVDIFKNFSVQDSENVHKLILKDILADKSRTNSTDTKYLESSVIEETELLSILKNLSMDDIKFSDYIVSTYPVMPKIFRGEDLGNEMQNATDVYYKELISATNESSPDAYDIFRRIDKLIGISPDTVKDKDAQPIIKSFFGKGKDDKGFSRKGLLAKRVHGSARSLITPMSDIHRKVDQLGVPFLVAINTWSLHFSSIFTKSDGSYGGQFPVVDSTRTVEDLCKLVATNQLDSMIDLFNTSGSNVSLLRDDASFLRGIRDNIIDANTKALSNESMPEINIKKAKEYIELSNTIVDFKSLFNAIRKVITSFCEEQVVLFGRQPSLHKFSIRAYRPVIINSKSFEIHPLVCKGYNADFDGDQMYMIALFLLIDQLEAMAKLSPVDGIINPKDGSPIIELTQDMLLGLYIGSALHDNVTDITCSNNYFVEEYKPNEFSGVISTLEEQRLKLENKSNINNNLNIHNFKSLKELEVMIDTRTVHPSDLATVEVDGKTYLSTAGRLRINMVFPDGFTDNPFTNTLNLPLENINGLYELKYDGLLAKKVNKDVKGFRYYSVSSITTDYFYNSEYSHQDVSDIIQRLMELGFTFSKTSGMTLSVFDIKPDKRIESYIEYVNNSVKEIEEYYALGLVSEDGMKKLSMDRYSELSKSTQKSIMDILGRNNNLFIIADSGARGNASQINQTVGVIGMSMKTLNESLDRPILSAYGRGLSGMEYFLATFGARMGVASAQDKTRDAGYATRQCAFMLAGFSIKEDDCETQDETLELKYDSPSRFVKLVEDPENPGETIEVDIILNSDGLEVTEQEIKSICKDRISDMLNSDKEPEFVIYEELISYYTTLLDNPNLSSDEYTEYTDILSNLNKIPKNSDLKDLNEYKKMILLNEDMVFATNSVKAYSAYYAITKPNIRITVKNKLFKLVSQNLLASREWSELDILGYFGTTKSKPKLEYPEAYIYRYNTDKVLEKIFENHIQIFTVDDTKYKIYYSLSKLYKNLLQHRVTNDLTLPHLEEHHFVNSETNAIEVCNVITEKTIKYLESVNAKSVNVRNLFGCKTFGGCCKVCYGLKFDTQQFPEINENIGFESAQAIGEPAAQLSLSLFHKGGLAGTSVASGVDILKALLKGNLPTQVDKSIIAQSTGYVKVIKPMDKGKCSIHLSGFVDRDDVSGFIDPENVKDSYTSVINVSTSLSTSSDVVVEDNQYVRVGDVLSRGFYDFTAMDSYITRNALMRNDIKFLKKLIRRKQVAMLETYFNTYITNDIEIYSRHFEVLSKCQNNLAKVAYSDTDKFLVGGMYEITEIFKYLDESPKNKVLFNYRTAKQMEVISHYSGTEASMLFERVLDGFKNQIGRTITKENLSMQSKVTTGTNMDSNELKVISGLKTLIGDDSNDEVAVTIQYKSTHPEKSVYIDGNYDSSDLGIFKKLDESDTDTLFNLFSSPDTILPSVSDSTIIEAIAPDVPDIDKENTTNTDLVEKVSKEESEIKDDKETQVTDKLNIY